MKRPRFNERDLRLLLMTIVIYRRKHEQGDEELRNLEQRLRDAVGEPKLAP